MSGQTYTGDGGVDRLTGGDGDDFFIGNGGNDVLKGGGGFDTAIFSGQMTDYSWSVTSKGYSITGPDGTDSLQSIERLQFDDFSYNLDGNNPAVYEYPTEPVETDVLTSITFTISGYDIDDPSYFFYITDYVPGLVRTELVETSVGLGKRVDATYTYTPSTEGFAYLAEGEAHVETLRYRSGGSDPSTAEYFYEELIVYGINDAPELATSRSNPRRDVVEDGGPVRYDFSFYGSDVDSDDDGTTLTYEVITPVDTLSVTFDGSEMVIDPLANYQLLSADQYIDETITIQAVDRHGARSNTLDVDIRIYGQDDPLQVFLTPDGQIDYAAVGINPAAEPFQGVISGYIDDVRLPDLLTFSDASDLFIYNGSAFYNFNENTSAYTFYETPWAMFPVETGMGNDTLAYRLSDFNTGFGGNDIFLGDGENAVIVDMDAGNIAEFVSNDLYLGTHSSQLIIDIDTAGSANFHSNDLVFGDGNDVMQVTVDAQGGSSDFSAYSVLMSHSDIHLGGGSDTLIIDLNVIDRGEIDFFGRITAWMGNDTIVMDNLDSMLYADFPFDGNMGFSGSVDLSYGDDVLDFFWKASANETARGSLSGGLGFDTLNLWGNSTDWQVVVKGAAWYELTNGGQTIDVSGFEAIFTEDGKFLPADENGLNVIEGTTSPDSYVGTEAGDFIRGYGSADTLDGAGGSDSLDGGPLNDLLYGRAGNDTIYGGHGEDTIEGGEDHDELIGGDGYDSIKGGTGNDTLSGGSGLDTLLGQDGVDYLEGGLHADVMNGGGGSDWAVYASSAQDIRVDMLYGGTNTGEAAGDVLVRIENLLGGEMRDFFYGDDAANVLQTGGGDDLLMGRGGDDTLEGGSGDDFLNGGLGADVLRGGTHGAFGDWVQYNLAASGVLVDLVDAASNQGEAAGDTFDSIENLFGSQHGDTLRGDDGFNYVLGLGGNDLIETRGGTDYVIAGAGDDTLDGGDQDDILLGGLGADHLIGGAGIDRAQYSQSDSGLVIDLITVANNTGEAAGDTYDSIENVYGSFFADSITGNTQANVLQGVGGADLLRGLGGDDALLGGNGFDTLEGGAGADTLSGGAGDDTASYAAATAGVRADLSAAGTNTGEAAGDVYASIENLTGSAFDDALYGDDTDNMLQGGLGADTLVGRDGADHLQGGVGDDILNGGAGADTLSGGSGFDLLLGGAGNDLLSGGESADRFVFQDGFGDDTLSDFDALDAMEQLVLSSLTAVSFTTYASFAADHLSTDGSDVILTAGSDTLRLQNTALSDLDASDFVF